MGLRGQHERFLSLDETKARNKRAVIIRLSGYLLAYWPQLALVTALTLINAAAFAAGPFLIGRAIDQFISVGDRPGLTRTMLLLLVVYIISTASMSGQFWLVGTMGQKVLARIREQIFAKILT
jgi:ABC-type multidrug transport system fused ATPase/permease subunit